MVEHDFLIIGTNNGEIRNRLDVHIISNYSDVDGRIMMH